jgi:beta-lactamase superfamily II metal-dependent hydrolase
VLSHLDQDHIAGALQFLRGWTGEIAAVHLGPDRDVVGEEPDARRAKSLLDFAVEQSRDTAHRARRWELRSNSRNLPLVQGEGWDVTLLAPSHGQYVDREREGEWESANRYSSILRVRGGASVMLIGGDAPLASWSELPSLERRAKVFRIPHHGGALDDGGIPDQWNVDRLYQEVGADTALISVGTNNAHGHPHEQWIRPISQGACRLLCTQVTPRCHAALQVADADGKMQVDRGAISALRQRTITTQNLWVEPQYRHLTDKRSALKAGHWEVPCAGTVLTKLFLDGRVEVLPAPGGGHEQVVDGWHQPRCRGPEA